MEQTNAQMFDSISESYDSINSILSFGIDKFWRKRFVKPVKQINRGVLLDIATGTGEILRLLQHSNFKFIGLDPSQKMLDVAEKKLNKSFESKDFKLICGSAENLSFEDNFVDIVTVTFGVRNFENLPKAFSEIYRVLKPSGKFMILEFSLPKNKILRTIYTFYLMSVLPFIGGIISGNRKAYKYLHSSIIAFAKNCNIPEEMRKVGFENINTKRFSLGVVSVYSAEKI